MVDISIAVEIMFQILKHNHRKLVFIAGDKDFCSMLKFLKREVPNLEICLVGFSGSMAYDIKEQASRSKVYFLDKDLHLFYQPRKRKERMNHYNTLKD